MNRGRHEAEHVELVGPHAPLQLELLVENLQKGQRAAVIAPHRLQVDEVLTASRRWLATTNSAFIPCIRAGAHVRNLTINSAIARNAWSLCR